MRTADRPTLAPVSWSTVTGEVQEPYGAVVMPPTLRRPHAAPAKVRPGDFSGAADRAERTLERVSGGPTRRASGPGWRAPRPRRAPRRRPRRRRRRPVPAGR